MHSTHARTHANMLPHPPHTFTKCLTCVTLWGCCLRLLAGLLHALLDCAETRQAVCRIMAGWSLQPLVAALTSQQVRCCSETNLLTCIGMDHAGMQRRECK